MNAISLSPGGRTSFSTTGPVDSIFVATIDGVRILERTAGGAWNAARGGLAGAHVGSLLPLAEPSLLFAGAHTGGLFVSRDGARTWDRAMDGIDAAHEQIYCLAAQVRAEGVVLWAGTEPAALFRSDDLGGHWTDLPGLRDVPGTEKWDFPPPPHIAHVKNVAFHPNVPATLYACIEQGALLRSTDDGRTWHELSGYSSVDETAARDTHRIAIAPSDPGVLYMTSGQGLYATRDAGTTWTHLIAKGDRIGYPDALFIDPRDERTLYVAGAAESPNHWRRTRDSNAAVMRSADGGRTWQELNGGLPERLHGNVEAMSLVRCPGGVTLVAGTAVGEVFLSEDGGERWTSIASELPPISKGGHYKAFLTV